MNKNPSHPFYQSLRFRFGLVFGLIFLCFLEAVVFLLYTNVKSRFEESFQTRLYSQGSTILKKIEISPLTIPLPVSNEYFQLVYQTGKRNDTLFTNLPLTVKNSSHPSESASQYRSTEITRNLETGGQIRILYLLPAHDLNNDIQKLRFVLFFYFPLSFLAALIAGYFLSGFLIRPIQKIVSKAQNISLQNEITLLEEPTMKDEFYHLTKSLNDMLTRIQNQARQQNAFFASASHELKTPLSIMLTELQVLQTQNLSEEINLVVQNQTAEVQRLSKLVNDFLLMSQLKANSVTLQIKPVDLLESCMDALEKFTKRAHLRGQLFKFTITPQNADFLIHTDRSQLTTILNNVLENAVKHGAENTTIWIDIIQNEDSVYLKIKNQSSVAISDLPALENEFRKNDVYSDGFGLGLWIVNELTKIIDAQFNISYGHPFFTAELVFRR